MFNRILLLALPFASSQLISMAVCSDNSCSKDCVYWNTDSGRCAPCDKSKGQCSALNPSSISTTNSITFYSDNTCSPTNIIQGFANIPITLDNNCNKLVSSGTTAGSYRATNLSVAIGLSVGISLTLILCCVCCCWKQKCCCFTPRISYDSTASTGSTGSYPTNSTVAYPAQDVPYNSNVTVAVPATWPSSSYNTTVVPPPPSYYPAGYGYPVATNVTYAVPPPIYPNAGAYPNMGQNAYPVANAYPGAQNAYPAANAYPNHGYGYPNQTVHYEDPTQPKVI
jgi:hypothetical protein